MREFAHVLKLNPAGITFGEVPVDPALKRFVEQALQVGGQLFATFLAVHRGASFSRAGIHARRRSRSSPYARESRLVTVPSGTFKSLPISWHDSPP